MQITVKSQQNQYNLEINTYRRWYIKSVGDEVYIYTVYIFK